MDGERQAATRQMLQEVRQAATERFLAALPPDDRQVLAWAAAERDMLPVQMLAGMIADEIAIWLPAWRKAGRPVR